MIKDYIKTPEGVFIHDDVKGMYVVNYQDNIDKVLGIKHDIEVMQKLLNLRLLLIEKMRGLIKFKKFCQITLVILETVNLIFNYIPFYRDSSVVIRAIVSLIVALTGEILLRINEKNNNKKIKQLLESIKYLEESINLKEQIFKRLAEDDTADLTPQVKMKSFNYYEKKNLLEKKLQLLGFYKNCREIGLKEKSPSLMEDKKVEEFVLGLIKK